MQIDSLDIQITAGAGNAEKSLDKLAGTIAIIQRQLGFSNVNTGFSKISHNANTLTNSFVKTNSVSKNLISSFGRMYVVTNSLKAAFKGLSKAITESMDYIETLNYFNNAWAQVAEKADLSVFEDLGYETADAYVKSFSERARQVTSQLTGFNVLEDGSLTSTGKVSLGIDPNQVMNYQAMFGQMASSIGLTSENSLLLSEALTKIGADLASVKNMDFDKVWKDMASGLAGMSRTLDKYGVNIRNVNLQQKLLDLGINANIANLNQNEKAMLRTIILLESTGYAYGDLAETINAPSNQLRLLKANFTNLARTIGNLFLPVVQTVLPYINGLVIALQRLFTWGGSLLGIDFSGITESISSVGGSDFSDLIGDTDDLSDGMDKASKSAKKMKDYLLGIDELNVIKPEEETGIDSLSGIGASGGLLDDAFKNAINDYLSEWDKAFAELEDKANKIADKIQAFFADIWKMFQAGDYKGIGGLVSGWITDGLDSIPWDGVHDFVKRYFTGLAEFMNGFINPELFSSVGSTLANVLNTVLYARLSFGESFDFKNLGDSIASGINSFFSTFDFEVLAENINVWVQGLFTTIKTVLENVDWGEVWKGVKDFFGTLEIETVAISLGTIAIVKWGKVALGSLGTAIASSISNAVVIALGAEEGTTIGVALLSWLKRGVVHIATQIGLVFEGLFSGLSISESLASVFGGSASGITSTLTTIATTIGGIVGVVGGAFTAIANFVDMLKNGFSWLNEIFMVLGVAIAGVGAVLLGAPVLIAGIVAGVVAAIGTIVILVKDNWETIKEWFLSIAETINTNVIQPILTFFKELWENIKSIWNSVSTWFSENVIEPVVSFFTGFAERVQQVFEGLWIIIQAVWITVSTWFSENVITPISNGFTELWNGIKEVWGAISTWFSENVVVPLSEIFNNMKITVSEIFSNLWNEIVNVWDSVSRWFNIYVIEPVQKAWETATTAIGGFFGDLWSGIKQGVVSAMNAVIGGIESAINFIVDGINKIIGGFNKVVSWAAKVAEVDWGGVDLVPTVSIPRIQAFYTGGFPESASLFWAGENGVTELLGTVNGRTAVAGGHEITGIVDAVYNAGNAERELLIRQNELLAEQNALLAELSNKEIVATMDARESLGVLRRQAERQGFVFGV